MLKTVRIFIACGGGRLLRQMLLLYAALMVVGLLLGGPTLRGRLVMGVTACGICTVMAAALIAVKVVPYNLRNRTALREIKASRARTKAMSPAELRAFTENLVATTTFFLPFPATRSPDPAMPPGVAEFFTKWDRVDFCIPGNPSPFLSLCRDLVGEVTNNPDAIKVGEIHSAGSCVAVSLRTGRVTCHHPPIRKNEVERVGAINELSHVSLWHLLANLGEAQRIAEGRNFAPYPRLPTLNNRPRWRIAGAKA